MLKEAGEWSDILEQLDCSDIGPVYERVSRFCAGNLDSQLAQSSARVLVPDGVGVAGEVEVGGKSSHVRFGFLSKTLYEQCVWVPDGLSRQHYFSLGLVAPIALGQTHPKVNHIQHLRSIWAADEV